MAMVETSKSELEKKIVEATNKLDLSKDDFTWITSNKVGHLLGALVDLKYYYLTHDGETTTINFEVLRSYFDIERTLQRILRNPKHVEYFLPASRLLEALEGWIDDLIKQGYRQLYPNIYKSFEDEYLDEDERFQNTDS